MLGNIKVYTKWIPYIIIVILICMLSISQCSRQKAQDVNHDQELKQAINQKQREIVEVKNREQEKIQAWKKDSLEMVASQNRIVKQIKAITRERDHARKIAQHFIDSIPEVKQFVALDDSVDRLNLSQIDTLRLDKIKMFKSFDSIISSKDEQIKIGNQLVKDFEQLNKELDKRVKRERVKKTGWKIIAGILGTALVAQSLDIF